MAGKQNYNIRHPIVVSNEVGHNFFAMEFTVIFPKNGAFSISANREIAGFSQHSLLWRLLPGPCLISCL